MKEEPTMAYRVVSNDARRHQQWIVARDETSGRATMIAGPFTEESIARTHCDALNRANVYSVRIKRTLVDRICALIQAGWRGSLPDIEQAQR
jgi:hypothetical protein